VYVKKVKKIIPLYLKLFKGGRVIRKRNEKTEETVHLAEGVLQKQLFLSTTGYGYPLILVLAKAAVSRFGQRPCGISIACLPSIDLLFRCALEYVCKK